MFDAFYESHGETPARYTDLLAGIADEGHAEEREQYVAANGSVFLAGNLVQRENIEKILNSLSDYGVTAEQYDAFGFSDYAKVKDIARTAVVNYRANLEYRLANLKEGETVESVKADPGGAMSPTACFPVCRRRSPRRWRKSARWICTGSLSVRSSSRWPACSFRSFI